MNFFFSNLGIFVWGAENRQKTINEVKLVKNVFLGFFYQILEQTWAYTGLMSVTWC